LGQTNTAGVLKTKMGFWGKKVPFRKGWKEGETTYATLCQWI